MIKIPFLSFVDAQQMHKDFAQTFQVPSEAELKPVAALDLVKVCCGGERFWVKISSVTGNTITGKVDNDLVRTPTHGLRCGDEIEFKKCNVYSIYRE